MVAPSRPRSVPNHGSFCWTTDLKPEKAMLTVHPNTQAVSDCEVP